MLCKKCLKIKRKTSFYYRKNGKLLQQACKACVIVMRNEYRRAHLGLYASMARVNMKRWRKKNPEEARARNKKHAKAWRKRNPEKARALRAAYRKRRKERLAAEAAMNQNYKV